MSENTFDIFIIGGGINGCGIARDAAGRGFSVCLCESSDLGSGTSSASTKLIHGGFRYLEHYEFRLVRESLKEREVLWKMAPHIIRPMRFVLPHHNKMRPAWLLRLGLFLYDHLGHRKLLAGTKVLNLATDIAGKSLKKHFRKAFEYSDCWVEDSRLVILNAVDAHNHGAHIHTRTRVMSAKWQDGAWNIDVRNELSSETRTIRAKLLINAAGPWVDEVLTEVLGRNNTRNVRLVRGSHIVVKKLFDHDRSYVFQNADERILFAIPYEKNYTLIGTTDADHNKSVGKPEITPEEIEYLCEMAGEYFEQPITSEDVVWSYSGVRPLYDDGATAAQEATRDYVITQECENEEKPLLNIFGGKITTYRRLSEAVLEKVENILGAQQSDWTSLSTLPGGDFDVLGYDALVLSYHKMYPFLDQTILQRLVRLYGTNSLEILGEANSIDDLGQYFDCGLYEAEVNYLLANEWAIDAEDILFRRTKLGINFDPKQADLLSEFMSNARSAPSNRLGEAR